MHRAGFIGEGEQGPRPGPRACGGPAGHQRGAPNHAKTPRGGASARGTAHGQGTRARQRFWRATSTFWGPRNVRGEVIQS